MKESDSLSLKLNHIIALILVLLAGILLSHRLFGEITFEAVQSVGSVILSLLLVFLYFNQTDILNAQQEFQESLERPVIQPRGFEEVEEDDPVNNDDETLLKFRLTNTGRIPARNLRLELIPALSVTDSDAPYEFEKVGIHLSRMDSEHSDWYNTKSSYLGPGESDIEYYTEFLHITWRNRVESSTSVASLKELHRLLDVEEEEMRLVGVLSYKDPNSTYYESLFDSVIHFHYDSSLARAISEGQQQIYYEGEFPILVSGIPDELKEATGLMSEDYYSRAVKSE